MVTKEREPNEQGFTYNLTGVRKTISHWDEDGNYSEKGFVKEEKVVLRNPSLSELKRQAEGAGVDIAGVFNVMGKKLTKDDFKRKKSSRRK